VAKLNDKQAEFLRGRNWGTLTTLRADGSPHSTPVWIDTDGENVIVNTVIGRAKEQHLRRDPRASVVVLPAEDQQSGYLSVTGTVEMSEDGSNEHIDKLAKKYIGLDEYPWNKPGDRRVIVRIRPERVESMGID
jgi:PPOX class probable F420-dependent enzyme